MQTTNEEYIYFTEFGMSYIEKADGVSEKSLSVDVFSY